MYCRIVTSPVSDAYLQDYQVRQFRSQSTACDRIAHLVAFFGRDTRAAALTTYQIRQYQLARRAAGAATGTINRQTSALHRMCTLAVHWGWRSKTLMGRILPISQPIADALKTNLQSRGLRTDRSLLVILDGAQALHTAVTQTFGPAALVQRCQVQKRRNVLEYLPEAQRPWVKATLTRAYTHTDVKAARRLLQDLARRVDVDYPSAAASIREGLDETLTVVELQLSERLRRSLATTNAVESLLSRTRHVKRNVTRWRGGTMVLRWVAAGVLEAAKGFRRVKGCRDMPVLVAACEHVTLSWGSMNRLGWLRSRKPSRR